VGNVVPSDRSSKVVAAVVADPRVRKQSGIGRDGGREGLLEFAASKYIAVKW
jgi:hypothetical protein